MKAKKQSQCVVNSISIEALTAETPLSAFLSLFRQDRPDGRPIDMDEAVAASKNDQERKAS